MAAGFAGEEVLRLAEANDVRGDVRRVGADALRPVGLVCCGVCRRRMHSHWLRGWPAYRCRHGHTTAHPAAPGRPRNLYLREDRVLTRVAEVLRGQHDPELPIDPANVATYLRQRGMIITCRQDSCTLDTNTVINQPMLINA
jgi:site-specific DNA recombinase